MRSISSRRDRLEVHEVEPQAIGRDERARLLDVRAEHLAQRRVQQVRGGVVAARGVAHLGVDLRRHEVAGRAASPAVTRTRCARGRPARMRARPSTDGRRAGRFADDAAGVGHLAAGLEIERRPRERDVAASSRRQRVDRLAPLVEQRHDRHARRRASSRSLRTDRRRRSSALPRRRCANSSPFLPPPNALCARALSRWPSIARSKPARSTRHALRRGGVLDEVVRHAERVVEPERGLARQHALRGVSSAFAISASSRGRPSVSTASNRFSSARIVFSIISRFASKLRIGVAHLAGEHARPAGAGTAR